jgi:iron complex transport system permease protein
MIAAKISRGYPLKILIITGLMIGALFNALLYIIGIAIRPMYMTSRVSAAANPPKK